MLPPIVDVSELRARRRDDPAVVVADVRSYFDGRVGRDAHAAGRLPGAVFVDLDADLAAPGSLAGGRHPLPEPTEFAAAMGARGIGDGAVVIAYDDVGGSVAARLVWMLRVTGHDAALLDGGLAAWTDAGGELETGTPEPPAPASFTPRPWPVDRLASADDVDAARDDPRSVILDARAAGRFTGAVDSPLDPRPGHVPGARSLPWEGNLDPTTGRFLPVAALLERAAAVGADDGVDVIAHCGSGVTACHDLLALEHVGITTTRLFVGSWSAWAADPDRPVATGDA